MLPTTHATLVSQNQYYHSCCRGCGYCHSIDVCHGGGAATDASCSAEAASQPATIFGGKYGNC
jgi:hypothetical protein